MTQEYEFFKDFAGVTKADLEMFKCGGKSSKKVKKMEEGDLVKKRKTKTYQDYVNQFKPKRDEGKAFQENMKLTTMEIENKKKHDEQVKHIKSGYDRRLDTPTNEDQNPYTGKVEPNRKHKKK